MTDSTKLHERTLPPKEAFASWLGAGTISDSITPSHIYQTLGCKHLGDYTELYCKSDVLLLADVFESFIFVCLGKYGLDPSHYITAPALSWYAMLKMTDIKLELLTVPLASDALDGLSLRYLKTAMQYLVRMRLCVHDILEKSTIDQRHARRCKHYVHTIFD